MGGLVHNAPPGEARETRATLVAELRRLEDELQRTQGRLFALGGETLPGIHLVIESAGRRGLLPAVRVLEVVRMVETHPLPGAAAHVRGTFVCRGAPVIAVELARLLGGGAEAGLDSQIVILAGSPPVGLVVDRVARLVEDPRLYEGDVVAGTPEGWRGSPLVVGLCVDEGEVVPVLDPAPVVAEFQGRGA
jgi:purine-binding chemotaxis protein CheW